jgi:alpha-amylase/alpha-mannosidase (GH57 family)
MSKKIYLAFLWHLHQPYYRLTSTGEFQMPWVRLHGIKDYYGMASLLEQFPNLKSNINLVPSLIKQIKEYLAGDADRLLFLARQSVIDLTLQDRQYILENSFLAHPQHMIGAFPRYKELYLKFSNYNNSDIKKQNLIKEFSNQDFIDLLVCSNLVWFHPLIMERDSELRLLRQKGRNYTETDKKLICQKQMDYLSQIIPLHKKLQDSNQIEITTTPFYHPILPLLCDMNSARQAMPDVSLPEVDQNDLLEDSRWQVSEAVRFYKDIFGMPVKGFWPAEGSVSPEIIPLLVEHHINYFASDEEILAHTLNINFVRDNQNILQNPQDLYQPYRIGNNLSVIFRDQYLSNVIGFQYQRWEPQKAVEHFINQIKSNARKVSYEFPLVSVILDGENPWEHYPNNGIEFLKLLYQKLSADDEIETVRISDYLSLHPPVRQLDTIYSGSWINHNFSIWVGHNEDKQAWEYIAKTKEAVKNLRATFSEERYNKIQENIYITEGSDWFWWFGHEHSSALDDQFDLLFRKHLMNVYHLLESSAPEYLYHQIKEHRQKELYSQPWGLLEIKLDGRRSDYFEWLAAGHLDISSNPSVSATMDRSAKEWISHIFFGFDRKNICLRLDLPKEHQLDSAKDNIRNNIFLKNIYFILNFLKPLKREIIIRNLYESISRSGKYKPVFSVLDENNKLIQEAPVPGSRSENPSGFVELETIAIEEIIEILCPLDILGFKKDDGIEFFVEVYENSKGTVSRQDKGRLLARYPDSQPIKLSVPAAESEYINWIA